MITPDEPVLITPDDSITDSELVDPKLDESGHRHHPDASSSCYVCLRGNLRGAHLERHLRTHTKERPFECPHCDYRASQKSTLYTHIALRHAVQHDGLNEDQQRQLAEDCSLATMATAASATTAAATAAAAAGSSDETTPGKSQGSRVDRWICAICSRRCPSAAHLRMHLRVHTKEKPYPCDFCPYRATTKGNLKLHVGRLHGANAGSTASTATSANEDGGGGGGRSAQSNPILSNLLLPILVPSEMLEIAMTVKDDDSGDEQQE